MSNLLRPKKFKSQARNRRISLGITYTVLALMSIIWLIPLLWIILSAFRCDYQADGTFIGTVTKKDLSKLGTFLIMALFGLIIASIVGLIMGNPDSVWISGLGVLIFAGLTVYDAQRIRNMMLDQETVNEGNMKLALLGALALYLDFINLLLKLLSLFGKRK